MGYRCETFVCRAAGFIEQRDAARADADRLAAAARDLIAQKRHNISRDRLRAALAAHDALTAEGGDVNVPDEAFTIGVAQGLKAERARIVEALAEIHVGHPYRMCRGCGLFCDPDGDCPTMRIAKGKT
jgi:hypothetical protein